MFEAVIFDCDGVLVARAARMAVWGFMGGGHMDNDGANRLLEAGDARLIRNWAEARDALQHNPE